MTLPGVTTETSSQDMEAIVAAAVAAGGRLGAPRPSYRPPMTHHHRGDGGDENDGTTGITVPAPPPSGVSRIFGPDPRGGVGLPPPPGLGNDATCRPPRTPAIPTSLLPPPGASPEEQAAALRAAWATLVGRDIPAAHTALAHSRWRRGVEARRVVAACARDVRSRVARTCRAGRPTASASRTKRLIKDLGAYWRRAERDAADRAARGEREDAEAARQEQEAREGKRQQQRLHFLLTQTELYAHFMANKLGTEAAEAADADVGGAPTGVAVPVTAGMTLEAAAAAAVTGDDHESLALRAEARRAAEAAIAYNVSKTREFDAAAAKAMRDAAARKAAKAAGGEPGVAGDAVNGTVAAPGDVVMAGGADAAVGMHLLEPSTMPSSSGVRQPRMFRGTLKAYQLRGLQWLANLYEQGINGILADEMGLGKTIQALSLLCHLAEEKDIWGPYLIICPSSTLPNWTSELARFAPAFRFMPYWGSQREREILRKAFGGSGPGGAARRIHGKEAPFHVLVTSYNLAISDEKYFRRMAWQFLVLDEAQAIKSSSSIRWKTLLGLNCRNRLLLTGTPIQNTMAELWALLHFVMPQLFDSLEQFQSWFARGIEASVTGGAEASAAVAMPLSRLHAILKPFMLRRVKADVEGEMAPKVEVVVSCELTGRQRSLYRVIRDRISAEIMSDGAAQAGLSEKKLQNLMNIVVQLRKLYSLAAALADSGKLKALDRLLLRLRTEGHRVLVFCQMSAMLTLLEDYMRLRRFRYLRLDGGTPIEDRRRMVADFQSRPEIFLFMLSTRAGGLGINLTGADTVIFYESDWNPTNDLQAMDRAHRLGQTRQVTVYRLITRGTVEERIVQRAGQKDKVQQMVIGGPGAGSGGSAGDLFEAEEVMGLLMDDEAELPAAQQAALATRFKPSRVAGWNIAKKERGGAVSMQFEGDDAGGKPEAPDLDD